MFTTEPKIDTLPASPLLRLPFEIRLMIYEYLLFPSTRPSTSNSTSVANIVPDFHTYYSEDTNSTPFTLSVRTIDPWLGAQGSRTWRRRSTYHMRTGPFLTSTTPTTYRVLLSPYTAHLRQNVPSLLALNRQIHAEASKVLYATYTFSFHTSIEAAVPFLSDLSPRARSHVRHLSLTKKALPSTKEYDRAEWSALCAYLVGNQEPSACTAPFTLRLRTLRLNIIAGKPDLGWFSVTSLTPTDFSAMMTMRSDLRGGDLVWVEQLIAIRGLEELHVKALVEHCAPPVSKEQAFWVAFSKSVDEGAFGEWIKGVMLPSRG
ncbi:uncharacterized protein K460DRAFT_345312 [Cucurbitaria berberidis CBS 394.84]|uniref:Uncharacterized protein n=1 Tax=Cucurbitaria berberidis CBS 394.84 TaxID=1168544 RepID=A0A9P4L538_9PLEO|nr:uncharacterized protein K460DRAFT_345312 [Cucurbitaria berberidis CBS 394.84]KAF1841939.1 hypothetical protein K460DRAFT_345312 [Cucurbitaria berberidis CBS 394.84]